MLADRIRLGQSAFGKIALRNGRIAEVWDAATTAVPGLSCP